MNKKYLIAPSILSADFTRLGEQIKTAEQAGADWIHVDVMDGHFVPNLTMGPFIVEACRKATNLPLDVHLMVSNPEQWVEPFAKAGASLLYVHMEATQNLHRLLQSIHQAGCRAGVVLNPGTPAAPIEPILHMVNVVLVMSVNPGYSGQSFLPEATPKIAQVRQMLDKVNPNALVAVDGGISAGTLPETLAAGAQVFIAASSIFKHPEGIAAGIRALRALFPA